MESVSDPASLRGYLRYLRHTRAADAVRVEGDAPRQRAFGIARHNLTMVASGSADTDDMEADFVDVDAHGYNEGDNE